jgi:hypothetical protein
MPSAASVHRSKQRWSRAALVHLRGAAWAIEQERGQLELEEKSAQLFFEVWMNTVEMDGVTLWRQCWLRGQDTTYAEQPFGRAEGPQPTLSNAGTEPNSGHCRLMVRPALGRELISGLWT